MEFLQILHSPKRIKRSRNSNFRYINRINKYNQKNFTNGNFVKFTSLSTHASTTTLCSNSSKISPFFPSLKSSCIMNYIPQIFTLPIEILINIIYYLNGNY